MLSTMQADDGPSPRPSADPASTEDSIFTVDIHPPLSALLLLLHTPSLLPHIHSAPVYRTSPGKVEALDAVHARLFVPSNSSNLDPPRLPNCAYTHLWHPLPRPTLASP
ncbi:hypothetical protein HETIRDRAFT_103913 [Heterobasidion irregulare TC 32-1]|uniref:Uncharacterized protein n=1 Tax=Heterobasidion irregulare (strain TC 32-1) TaxID=747525 RepID=W4JY76_HETIT|nr:uncharacterized protein HETIRDRAFT_103913 [Heterobasidion irregulare TC 32-1]ETW78498.1 hypothetical protein HETIRDRAFT_103913 [Heterobasidion irregulare TC 32-1]